MPGQSDPTSAKVQALTPRERVRLAGILARLASPYESERAAAGLLASAFVTKHGLTWADLVVLLRPLPEAPAMADGQAQTHDRRQKRSNGWRGFCRRRLVRLGQALDRLT